MAWEHTRERDLEVVALIRAHIEEHGPRDWVRVERDTRLDDYNRADVWTLIRAVRGDEVESTLDLLHQEKRDIVLANGEVLPAQLDAGENWLEQVTDLVRRQAAIDRDISLLRDFSVTPDGKRVKAPVIFAAALDKQQRALEFGLKIAREVYDVERMRGYLAGVADIIRTRIADVDPELHKAILGDLEALNARYMAAGGQRGAR